MVGPGKKIARVSFLDNAFPLCIQNNNPRVQKNPIMGNMGNLKVCQISTLPGSGTTGKIPWNNWNTLIIVCVHRYVCHREKFSCYYFPLGHRNGTGIILD